DEVGNQIGTTLVLVLHIRPLRLRVFIIGRDVVDTAACQQQAGEHGKKRDLDAAGNIYCMAHAISPMGLLIRPNRVADTVRWSSLNDILIRSFGLELQRPSSTFTRRARIRDPKSFSLSAHNQELFFGHVTFFLPQLFLFSLSS